MDVTIRQLDGGVTAVAVTGELNSRTAPDFQDKLLPLAQPGCRMLIDMSNVSYMSSAGLRILLLLYRQIDASEGKVVLTGLIEMVRDTMAITGFLDFFEDYKTFDEGLSALNL